jgi:cyclopropane fatty-acyl-phospholipid synthase-like methyltransferase
MSYGRPMESLPDPAVSPAVYDETYYREWCAGYAEWVASDGGAVAGIYPGFLRKAGLRPGEVVVDMGAGRGELLVVAVEQGAERAYGIEYSPDAVRMARRTIESHGVADRVEILLGDARSTALPDGVADLVCFVDVVEHLTPTELHDALGQARRLLKPRGRIVAHTMPNRLIDDVTYRALRWLPGYRSWAANPRVELERVMHVNEQTVRSLRRSFERAGLEAEVRLGQWIHTEHVPSRNAKRLHHLLARLGPLAQLGVGDIWAFGRRAGSGSGHEPS